MAELPNRVEKETALTNNLKKLFRKKITLLVPLLGSPPRMSNIPASFWDGLGKDSKQILIASLAVIYATQASKHKMKKSLASSRGLSVSTRKSVTLAGGMIRNIKSELKQKQREWRKQHETGTLTKAKLRGSIDGSMGSGRAEGISRTAITDIAVDAAEDAAGGVGDSEAEDITSPDDKWFTEIDGRVCPICSPLNNKKRRVWQSSFPTGPPAHPQCRCHIFYINLEL